MLAGVIALAALAALCGLLLVTVAARAPARADPAVERVNAVLPQTQCAQCGYPGCRPYAAAIVAGSAAIDRCPPGGEATRRALAALTGTDPDGAPALPPAPAPHVVVIDEAACIGCALCLPACPVDAIVGAHRYAHTVVAALCTGCDLCLPACPVDCIVPAPAPEPGAWRPVAAA